MPTDFRPVGLFDTQRAAAAAITSITQSYLRGGAAVGAGIAAAGRSIGDAIYRERQVEQQEELAELLGDMNNDENYVEMTYRLGDYNPEMAGFMDMENGQEAWMQHAQSQKGMSPQRATAIWEQANASQTGRYAHPDARAELTSRVVALTSRDPASRGVLLQAIQQGTTGRFENEDALSAALREQAAQLTTVDRMGDRGKIELAAGEQRKTYEARATAELEATKAEGLENARLGAELMKSLDKWAPSMGTRRQAFKGAGFPVDPLLGEIGAVSPERESEYRSFFKEPSPVREFTPEGWQAFVSLVGDPDRARAIAGQVSADLMAPGEAAEVLSDRYKEIRVQALAAKDQPFGATVNPMNQAVFNSAVQAMGTSGTRSTQLVMTSDEVGDFDMAMRNAGLAYDPSKLMVRVSVQGGQPKATILNEELPQEARTTLEHQLNQRPSVLKRTYLKQQTNTFVSPERAEQIWLNLSPLFPNAPGQTAPPRAQGPPYQGEYPTVLPKPTPTQEGASSYDPLGNLFDITGG